MELPKQKAYYDTKRQFQGRDQPTDVAPDSPIMQEEVFGPVVALIDCEGPEDAIRIANGIFLDVAVTADLFGNRRNLDRQR